MRRLILFFTLILLASCTREVNQTRLAMGTVVEIKLWGSSDSLMDEALKAALAEIGRVESLTSAFSPKSALWALNSNGEIVSWELAGLLKEAIKVSNQSQSRFDPTVMPLMELWGFRDSTGSSYRVPSKDEIESILRFVDYRMIKVSGDTIRFWSPQSRTCTRSAETALCGVDLGGIAKGYAVDRAVKVLRERGVREGLVNAGGDIFCFGKHKGGWQIGIRNPRNENPNELLGVVRIDSGAIATSGDYENFFVKDGIRYHHIMDPAQGYPARGAVSSTIIAPTATQADAWATALFVLGKKGIAILDSIQGIEGMLVLDNGEIVKTRGFPLKP